jgi:phosphopantetheinyl transferase (holo-ACP synthase)
MLGNDIVDLDDAETAAGAQHPRFDARVFSDLERDAIARAEDPRRLRWATWAAKEAAFKAARRVDAAMSFSPLAFRVNWSTAARASVFHAAQRFEVEIEDLPGALHAIARREGESRSDVLSGAGLVATLASESRDSQAPSDAARRLARARLASWLEIDEERIRVTREGGLPGLCLDEKLVDATLSFSHHGRFAAFACRIGAGEPSAR